LSHGFDNKLRRRVLELGFFRNFAKNTAHNERRLPNFAYLCSEIKYQIMKYEELDNNVVSVSDTETMDLETARQLLHQMVKEVYAKP